MLDEIPPLYLTFDDVLLRPAASSVLPAEVSLTAHLARDLHLAIPLLSSAMDTVTEAPMALALGRLGGLGVLHRNLSPAAQAAAVAEVKAAGLLAAAAVGTSEGDLERARLLVEAGCDVLVVDTAHGHSARVLDRVRSLKAAYPGVALIAGNVATAEGTLALIEAGADAVKVGVGPGSICTTRRVAGVGVPQLSAVGECARAAAPHAIPIIADGGITGSGDIVKALAAGASTVMVGGLLAGADEAPGALVEVDGRRWKAYRGMGSVGAMADGAKDRYFQGGVARDKLVAEGVEARVPARGPVAELVHPLMGGLRSGMGYVGAPTLEVLRRDARFVRVSPAGLRESHVHDVTPTGGTT